MKTKYDAHDEIYKTRRATGKPGWQDSDSLENTLARLAGKLTNVYVPQSGRALELGCGAGDQSLLLSEMGYDAHGVDISPTAIDWAREKAVKRRLQAKFQVGSVLDLAGFADDYFDLVLDGYCFHCIIGPDRARFLASARRVLKPKAVLHVATMCGEVTSESLLAKLDLESRCVLDQDGVATRYVGLPEDILTEIQSAGFQVLEWNVMPRTDADNDMDELQVWATRD